MLDSLLKFDGASVVPAPDFALGEEAEPSFHLADPRSAGRCEVQMVAGPLGEPLADALRFMRPVVIENDVDIQVLWHFSVDAIEKLSELHGPVPTVALPVGAVLAGAIPTVTATVVVPPWPSVTVAVKASARSAAVAPVAAAVWRAVAVGV